MGDLVLNIAEEFSRFPAGRQDVDGPFNGDRFRVDLLAPMLREAMETGGKLTVNMDGLMSCGSSFLDSAFGGLVRDEKISKNLIKRHLRVVTSQEELGRYRDAAVRYIDRAQTH